MKVIKVTDTKLDHCVRDAQEEDVVLVRNGTPVAVIVGIKDMDLEQVELSMSDKFWKLVKKWRAQKTLTQEELDERLRLKDQEDQVSNSRPVARQQRDLKGKRARRPVRQ